MERKINYGFIYGLVGFCTIFLVGYVQSARTTFSCNGRISGYYADVSAGCQIYHMCDGLGRQFSYACPNATLFQQRMLICDHWYMVNCSKSESNYDANLLIGQKGKPFVGENNPYHRTPRPDLLLNPSSLEYNIIYRTNSDHFDDANVIGRVSDTDTSSTSKEPTYFLPSHWSTEHSKRSTTIQPFVETRYSTDSIVDRNELEAQPQSSVFIQPRKPEVVRVNFKSNFQATTPVYPTFVEESLKLKGLVLQPPLEEKPKVSVSNRNGKPVVNFVSNFVATTPDYPLSVEATSPQPDAVGLLPPLPNEFYNLRSNNEKKVQVNFQSNYAATIPVYPQSVEATSPIPSDIGLLPPLLNKRSESGRVLNQGFQPDLQDQNTQDANPPKQVSTKAVDNKNFFKLSNDQWVSLRNKFLIPDFQFPLDAASRPSYETDLSSFQARTSAVSKR